MELKRSLKPWPSLIAIFCAIMMVLPSHARDGYEPDLTTKTEDNYTDEAMGKSNWQTRMDRETPNGFLPDLNKVKRSADKYTFKKTAEDKQNQLKSGAGEKVKSNGSFWVKDSGKVIVYALAALLLLALIGYLIVYVFREGAGSRTDGKSDLVNGAESLMPDAKTLQAADLDQMLTEALSASDYRSAVRLLYLTGLKRLMKMKLLKPSPEKTNFDYVRELSGTNIQELFVISTSRFERAWYGEYPISPADFKDIELGYRQLFASIDNR